MGPGVPSTSISPNFTVPKGQFSFYFYIITVSSSKKHSFTLMPCPSLPNIACTLQLCLLVKLMVLFIIYIHHFSPSFRNRSAKYIQIHFCAASQNILVSKTVDIFLYPHMCVCRFFFMDHRKLAKKNSICKNLNVQAYTHISKGCVKVFLK